MTKFGDKYDAEKEVKGTPSVIFQFQPTGYILAETPEEIRQWEEDVKRVYGAELKARGDITLLHTCSGGVADDCGQLL